MRHMWTAPSSQDDEVSLDDRIACVHMSGLFARSHMNAGQDGLRDVSPNQRCDLDRSLSHSGLLTSGIDRSRHLSVLLQASASAQHDRQVLAVHALLISMQRTLQQELVLPRRFRP